MSKKLNEAVEPSKDDQKQADDELIRESIILHKSGSGKPVAEVRTHIKKVKRANEPADEAVHADEVKLAEAVIEEEVGVDEDGLAEADRRRFADTYFGKILMFLFRLVQIVGLLLRDCLFAIGRWLKRQCLKLPREPLLIFRLIKRGLVCIAIALWLFMIVCLFAVPKWLQVALPIGLFVLAAISLLSMIKSLYQKAARKALPSLPLFLAVVGCAVFIML